MLLEILCFILASVFLYKSILRPKYFPPGPRGLPLIGYFPFIMRWDSKLPHKALKKMCDVYGPVTGFFVRPNKPMIAVSGHEAVREALMNDDLLGRPHSPGLLARTLNQRIMFVDGPLWQEQRRFSIRHLKDLGFGKTSIEDQMMNEVLDLIDDIKTASQAHPSRMVDFKGLFQVSVVNILWTIIGGKRFERDDPEFKRVLHVIEQFFRAGNPLGPRLPLPAFVYKFFPALTRLSGLRLDLMRPMLNFIQANINEHLTSGSHDYDRDFIDVYLKEIERHEKNDLVTSFTYKQLAAIILDIFGAGAESTSNTIGFAIIHLIRNPEVQRKMQSELDRVCGNRLPTFSDRSLLPYTEAVLMEAQRCSTIIPMTIPHTAMKDTKIKEYFIPKGSIVMINLDSVLNEKDHWIDPENFRPERHLNEDGTKIMKSDHFYPFGAGRRLCTGESLARNTYFLFTAALVKTFSFRSISNELMPTVEPLTGFTLGYKGFNAVVVQRDIPSVKLGYTQ